MSPRGRWIAAALAAGLIALLGISQLLLPGIASERLRDSLRRDARGVSVSVSATPAITLLFDRADSVSVAIDRLEVEPGGLAGLIDRAARTGELDATVDRLAAGRLELSDAALRKRGDSLTAEATLSRAALDAALPPGLRVDLAASRDGSLIVAGDLSVFGGSLAAQAAVTAADGAIELRPGAPLLSELIAVTVFEAPGFSVDRLEAVPSGAELRLSAAGHYR